MHACLLKYADVNGIILEIFFLRINIPQVRNKDSVFVITRGIPSNSNTSTSIFLMRGLKKHAKIQYIGSVLIKIADLLDIDK